MRSAKDAFLVKEWLAADADSRLPADPALANGVSCDEAGCVAEMADGAFVSLALHPEALEDDCERATLIVTAKQAPPDCAAAVISLDRLRRQGTLALRKTRDGFAINAVRPAGFDRPWSPAVAGEGEVETGCGFACETTCNRCDAVGRRPAVGGVNAAGRGELYRDETGSADNTRRAIAVDIAADGFEQQKEFLGKHENSPVKNDIAKLRSMVVSGCDLTHNSK